MAAVASARLEEDDDGNCHSLCTRGYLNAIDGLRDVKFKFEGFTKPKNTKELNFLPLQCMLLKLKDLGRDGSFVILSGGDSRMHVYSIEFDAEKSRGGPVVPLAGCKLIELILDSHGHQGRVTEDGTTKLKLRADSDDDDGGSRHAWRFPEFLERPFASAVRSFDVWQCGGDGNRSETLRWTAFGTECGSLHVRCVDEASGKILRRFAGSIDCGFAGLSHVKFFSIPDQEGFNLLVVPALDPAVRVYMDVGRKGLSSKELIFICKKSSCSSSSPASCQSHLEEDVINACTVIDGDVFFGTFTNRIYVYRRVKKHRGQSVKSGLPTQGFQPAMQWTQVLQRTLDHPILAFDICRVEDGASPADCLPGLVAMTTKGAVVLRYRRR